VSLSSLSFWIVTPQILLRKKIKTEENNHKDHTVLHGIRVLKIALPWKKKARYFQGNKFKIVE
jgi:hypothetical protein